MELCSTDSGAVVRGLAPDAPIRAQVRISMIIRLPLKETRMASRMGGRPTPYVQWPLSPPVRRVASASAQGRGQVAPGPRTSSRVFNEPPARLNSARLYLARAVVPPPRLRAKCVAFSAALHDALVHASTGLDGGLGYVELPANPCTTGAF